MSGYKIEFTRPWPVAHRGAPEVTFGPGKLSVPDDISDELAQRALRAGRARLIHEPASITIEEAVTPPNPKRPARTKARAGAPENK